MTSSYNKRSTTTNWGRDKKQKSEPLVIELGLVKHSAQNQSITVRGTVVEKSPEKTSFRGPFVVVSAVDKGHTASLFFNANNIGTAKEIVVGKTYDFIMHSVMVKAPYSKKTGQRETFYGQTLSVNDVQVRLVEDQPDYVFESLTDGMKKLPDFEKPISFMFVEAALEVVEGKMGGEKGKIPAEARCKDCHGGVRGSPPNSAGDAIFICDSCSKNFSPYTADWIFGNTWVVLKGDEAVVRVVLGDSVLKTLLGNTAKYFMDAATEPKLEPGSTLMKWLLKAVYSQYQEVDQVAYFATEWLGNVVAHEPPKEKDLFDEGEGKIKGGAGGSGGSGGNSPRIQSGEFGELPHHVGMDD